VIRDALGARRPGIAARPTYQWEAPRSGVQTLRLFGRLGRGELRRVVDAVTERGRSPREHVCIDFEEVEHLDYRALPEFSAALARQRDRGASIWFVGLNPYLRCLFQVAGEGPLSRQLEWRSAAEPDAPSYSGHGPSPGAGDDGAARAAAWSATETIH
jgi:anti-anti-sigma regulatory factor